MRERDTMTEKELKKLNRYQLLELLLLQTKRAEQLEAELSHERERLAAVEEKLRSREMKQAELGSIAEASLQLSGVFQAAQTAAELYLEEAKKRAREIEEEAKTAVPEVYLEEARERARQIEEEAYKRAAEILYGGFSGEEA